MSDIIWPSEIGVGDYAGSTSQWAREFQMARFIKAAAASTLQNFVAGGGALSLVSSSLAVDVAAISAILEGRWCQTTDTRRVTGLQASSTNFVYLQLTYSSGTELGSSLGFTSNITGTVPDCAVCVGQVITSGTEGTSKTEAAQNPRIVFGTYAGNGNSDRSIFLGFQPSLVEVFKGNESGSPGVHVAAKSSGGFVHRYNGATWDHDVTATAGYVPIINNSGFSVGTPNLNDNGKTYYYRAWA